MEQQLSIKICLHALLFIFAAASSVIIFLIHESPWEETLRCIAVGTVLIFLFYLYLLLFGVCLEDDGSYCFQLISLREYIDFIDIPPDVNGFDLSVDFGDGFLALFFGVYTLLASLVGILMLMAVLIWAGINLVLLSYMALMMPLLYAFRCSLRLLVEIGRDYKGRLGASALLAAALALPKGLFLAALVKVIYLVVG